jgi:hypothetical protein
MVEAIRHTQAAGDCQEAARLLADRAFSLMVDGQVQTIQALLRAFPREPTTRAGPGARYGRRRPGALEQDGRPSGGRRDLCPERRRRIAWLNWLVCSAGVGLQLVAPVRARLAGLCCRSGILRVQGDEVVVESCFESGEPLRLAL